MCERKDFKYFIHNNHGGAMKVFPENDGYRIEFLREHLFDNAEKERFRSYIEERKEWILK
jgi:hypothetical protein